MTRIFLDESQIEEIDNFDILENLDNVFDDDWDAVTESTESDWCFDEIDV